jgi:hypothetical protein
MHVCMYTHTHPHTHTHTHTHAHTHTQEKVDEFDLATREAKLLLILDYLPELHGCPAVDWFSLGFSS